MGTSDIPVPQKGFLVAHFLTVKDQAKSKEFYVGVLGGKIVKEENPCYIKLENSWVVLNSGGGPTPDKPDVWLAPPQDLNTVSTSPICASQTFTPAIKSGPRKVLTSLLSPSIIMATNCAATCVIRTVTSSRSGSYSQLAIDAFKKFAG